MGETLEKLEKLEADNLVLETALHTYCLALDRLIEACLDDHGGIKQPDRGEIMRARSMLSSKYKHTLIKPGAK